MQELKVFRKVNGLTQTDIGNYLGLQKSFISRIENGYEKFPYDKYRKLLSNDKDWDTSMLPNISEISISASNSNVNNGRDQNVGTINEQLTATIRELHKLLAKKDEQIDRLITIIEKN